MPPKQAPRRGASSTSSRQPPTTAPGPNSTSTSTSSTNRQPVQRLQSLKRTAPAGSIAPTAAGASTSAARSSATPGPGTGAGDQPSKPTLKYKPRAVGRRSKEERDAIEQVEAQRHRERVQEAAAIQRGRGGGAGASGRGGTRGRGGPLGGGHGNGNVGGPLGSGMSGGARRGRGGRFGPGAGAAGDSRASSMTQRSRTRSVIDMGMGNGGSGAASRDVSSDESDSGNLVDINQINLDSDEEGSDEALETKMKNRKGKGKGPVTETAEMHGEKSLRPIRVERHEHAERVVSVNMESSSSKSAELRQQAMAKAMCDDDLLFVPQDDETEQQQQQQPRVKDEPTDDGDQVMKDVPAAASTDDGLLPEQTVKVRRKLDKEPEPPSATAEPAAKDPKSLLRTKEDMEEYERHEQDLEVVKGLLSVEPKEPKEPKQKQPEQPATEGDTAAEPEDDASAEPEDTEREKLSGQLFLMQFPPMTPNLVVPGTAAADGVDGTEQAEATVAPPDAEPSQSNEQSTVKREDDAAIDLDAAADFPDAPPPKLVTATNQQLPAGRVGKLNVHASGRVTMDWGGISFELDKATDVDFLQEALVLSTMQQQLQQHEPGVKMEELEETEEKKAWAMGQLSGKFTVTPDWASIL